MSYRANEVISGTHGEVWINGEKFAEVYGLQAKVNAIKEDVPMCGTRNGRGKKNMGWDGTGTVRYNKINSRLLREVGEAIKNGKDMVFTIISKLADPSSRGAERIALYNCSFDDVTLIDWEANRLSQIEAPFTFDNYEFIDLIN